MPEVLANLGEAYASLSDQRRASECFDEALRMLDERAQRGAEGNPTGSISVRLVPAAASALP